MDSSIVEFYVLQFQAIYLPESLISICDVYVLQIQILHFADKVRIAGLWKTVLSEVVQKVQSVIGQLCLCLFLSVHLSVEWIKW